MVTKVVVADDHPVVRIGSRAILEMEPNTEVVAEAGSLDELFALLQDRACDVLVLCLRLSGARFNSGVAAIAAVRRAYPGIRVIVFPDSYSPQTVRMAISLGALGVVAKDEASTELRAALRSAREGIRYVSSGIHRTAIGSNEVRRLNLDEELLLQLLADGNTLEEVAYMLQLSVRQAKVDKRKAMAKLGIESPAELYGFLSTWRFDEPADVDVGTIVEQGSTPAGATGPCCADVG